MHSRSFVLGALLGASLSLTVAAAARPGAPEPVRRAVTRIFADAPTTIEAEDDKYEVTATTRLEVVLDARGAVEEVELKLPLALVPAPVLAAARSALPAGARVAEADLLLRGATLAYELEARAPTGEVELILDGAGKLLSQRSEPQDDDDDDD